jgi:hypothetical protein
MRVTERLIDDAPADSPANAPAEFPRPVTPLSYAPAAERKVRLTQAGTVTLMISGTLLVIAPAAAIVWAYTAQYYNDTVNALTPYALTSAAVGILMLIAAISRGATQRDPML